MVDKPIEQEAGTYFRDENDQLYLVLSDGNVLAIFDNGK